jgi:hypothetical protein
MKFATDLGKGVLGNPDSQALWTEIIDHIPDEVLLRPDVKILSVACGHATEAVILARRMLALGIPKQKVNDSIWLLDKYKTFTNHAHVVYGFQNIITADFISWETNMKFDVVIGNPPYNSNDTSREGIAHRGQGDNLAKKFTLKALSLSSRYVCFIIPYGHRTYSPNLQKRFQENGLYKIQPCSDHFKGVSTNPCVFYFDKTKPVPTIEDQFNSHVHKVPKNNIGDIFRNQPGRLNRTDYEHLLTDQGQYQVVVTTAVVKYTDDVTIVNNMKDTTRGNWRVVFNCTTSLGKFGKIIVVGPEAVLSKSVHCLILPDQKSAIEMKEYLESEAAQEILVEVKIVNACNSKKFLQYIPMPEK